MQCGALHAQSVWRSFLIQNPGPFSRLGGPRPSLQKFPRFCSIRWGEGGILNIFNEKIELREIVSRTSQNIELCAVRKGRIVTPTLQLKLMMVWWWRPVDWIPSSIYCFSVAKFIIFMFWGSYKWIEPPWDSNTLLMSKYLLCKNQSLNNICVQGRIFEAPFLPNSKYGCRMKSTLHDFGTHRLLETPHYPHTIWQNFE